MAPPLIQMKDIALTFGGTPLLSGVELSVSESERLCRIGRNGSGKSTLLKIAAGLVEPDSGSRFVQPGATVRYLQQEPDFAGFKTTLEYVEAGLGPGDDSYQARYLIEQLGLTGNEDPAHLSGGESRRTALARVLAPSPDILLLDEPTNHLDLTTIEWLESELGRRRGALVLISHDRRFLSNLSRSTAWLDRGQIRQIDRGFAKFEEWRDEVLAEEERDQHKLDRKIVAEEHWLRYGVSGRRKRNVKRLGNLHELRQQRRDFRGATGNANLAAAEADKSGKLVIEAKNIEKSYGDRKIVENFSIRVQRGDRIGIVGPNGAGKTTLINMLTGADAPDAGMIRLGANIEMATLDQHRESLDPKSTLAEALTGGRGDHVMVGGKPKHVVSYMKDFLFAQEQMRTPLEVLSGGERGRLMLARSLAKPSNLLVLDEPTNDLDLETLDVLEEMLGDYEGTVILISHDRDFLDRVVTSVIAPEGGGRWIEYAGGYTDMLAQRGADLKREAPKSAVENGKAQKGNAPPGAAKRRLNFNEKHLLETLPKTIARLQAEIAKQQRHLDDPDLYKKNRKKFDTASAALSSAQKELQESEDKWLDLEMLREEIESADMTTSLAAKIARDYGTPAVVIDMDRVERNIARIQAACVAAGVANRPHIKTHKNPTLAKMQIAAGAQGITCQKLGEAEVMAEAGIDDILISYNLLGDEKMARLAALQAKANMTVAADNAVVIAGLPKAAAQSGRPLSVVVECDTGRKRAGVETPAEAIALAREIAASKGLTFAGFMLYPTETGWTEAQQFFDEALAGVRAHGLDAKIVSTGGSPNMKNVGKLKGATEHRPGTYIYNDRMQVAAGVASWDDCALTVYSTVVSRASPDRGILDAGSKTLTSDTGGGLEGHGLILEHPEAKIARFAEEHGFLDLTRSNTRPAVGDVVRIVPNHVCVVVNMVDEVVMVRGDEIIGTLPVAARGRLR